MIKSLLVEGSIVNHERWMNKKFEDNYMDFELFWTSPKNQSYYNSNYLTYNFRLTKTLSGITLITSPSDLEKEFSVIPDYGLDEISDTFKNLWYGILEKDLLGFKVEFINLYDKEIIFSNKNLKYLIEI